jgi:peroxiredoxin
VKLKDSQGNFVISRRIASPNRGAIVMAWKPSRILGILLTLGTMALFLGCQEKPKEDKAKSSNSRPAAKSATQTADMEPEPWAAKSDEVEKGRDTADKDEKAIPKRPKPKTPPPPLTIPKVGLSDALRATCLVNVGDMMPDAELFSPDGGKVSLENQYGEKYTVLFFWSEAGSNYLRLSADAALQDLQGDVADPYAAKGVKVIGINVGDNPAVVRQELMKAGVKSSCFFDPDKAFFSKVAKSKLPRVYLLDASGKIIWFDTEYTQSTRRNLMQAIKVLFGEK